MNKHKRAIAIVLLGLLQLALLPIILILWILHRTSQGCGKIVQGMRVLAEKIYNWARG